MGVRDRSEMSAGLGMAQATPGTAACASCPAHNRANLVKLGVDMRDWDYVVALAGNPNTGKSTVFNALTGLRQHTGNWPGKTVTRAEGGFVLGEQRYKLVDLPGTYSLLSSSYDEEIARDFILFGQPDVTLIVVDANRLERNLNLVLQVLQITDRAVICLNLMDEAQRHGLVVDDRRLARDLGVPVVPTAARQGEGLDRLQQAISEVATGQTTCKPLRPHGRSPALSDVLGPLTEQVRATYRGLPNSEWVALRLLDGDERIGEAFRSGELADLSRSLVAVDADTSPVDGAAESPPERLQRDVVVYGGMSHPPTPEEASSSGAPPPMPARFRAPRGRLVAPAARRSVVKTEPCGATPPERLQRNEVLATAAAGRWKLGPDHYQTLVEGVYAEAARIADRAVSREVQRRRFDLDRTIDRLVTSRTIGIPLMVLMLAIVFWLTVAGANVPSKLLSVLLIDTLHPLLKGAAAAAGFPGWLDGLLLDGVYLSTAWVVSVMLPPMAIFFPLFTLLEDFGYLPRVAFNLDRVFKRVGAHGKQGLTMAMGFGCNAAGVVSARIIESPRERLIATITNNFALCNGRWPTQILVASIFIGVLAPPYLAGLLSAMAVVAVVVLGVLLTLATSWLLSRTLLRGEASAFSLELPPYRPPRILQTLYTSLIDRTLFVLWRALVFAAPAGALIWLISNIEVGDASVALHLTNAFDPFGRLIGLSGVILLAYIIAIPANEIVIPTVLMLTVMTTGLVDAGGGAGVIFELESETATAQLLEAGGWNLLMAVNLMLFSLVHNPCSTTIYTIWKETRSAKWTAVSALLPLGMGLVLCFLVAQVWRIVTSAGL